MQASDVQLSQVGRNDTMQHIFHARVTCTIDSYANYLSQKFYTRVSHTQWTHTHDKVK
jgi:hypothetical protein